MGAGFGIVHKSPHGGKMVYSIRCDFKAMNNKAEYEALIIGMNMAHDLGATGLHVKSDTLLVINQMNGEFEAKESKMTAYLKVAKAKSEVFQHFSITQIPMDQNTQADALANLGTMALQGTQDHVVAQMNMELTAARARIDALIAQARQAAETIEHLRNQSGYHVMGTMNAYTGTWNVPPPLPNYPRPPPVNPVTFVIPTMPMTSIPFNRYVSDSSRQTSFNGSGYVPLGVPSGVPIDPVAQRLKILEVQNERVLSMLAKLSGAAVPVDVEPRVTDPTEHVAQYKQLMWTVSIPHQFQFGATLTGAALQWLINLKPKTIGSFAELVNHFSQQFASSRKMEKQTSDLYYVVQKNGESIRDYFNRFNAEMTGIQNCDVKTTIEAYKQGLDDSLGLYLDLTKYPPETFEDVRARTLAHMRVEDDLVFRNKHSSDRKGLAKDVVTSLKQLQQNIRWPKKSDKDNDNKDKKMKDMRPTSPEHAKVINCITGGSDLCGTTYSAAKRHASRGPDDRPIPKEARSKEDAELEAMPLMFNQSDLEDVHQKHHDGLIIQLSIGNCLTKRILVDGGSSANIIFFDAVKAMGIDKSEITRRSTTFIGFNGGATNTTGEITLLVYAKGINRQTKFNVVDCSSAYNVILGRPWIHDMNVIPSTYHQTLKIPTQWGVQEIKGERKSQDVPGIDDDYRLEAVVLNQDNPDQMVYMLVKLKHTDDHIGHLKQSFDILREYKMKCHLFYNVLRKNKGFEWTDKHEEALQQLKEYMTSPPFLSKPEKGKVLQLYLAVSVNSVSAVLTRETDGRQLPIYYVSKTLLDAETSPELEEAMMSNELIVATLHDTTWTLDVDGSSNIRGTSLGVILQSPQGGKIVYSIRCDFKETNNEAEYEALIARIKIAHDLGETHLHVRSESSLVHLIKRRSTVSQ
ncbi:hypothetical protein L6452_01741 [Arctium lappa]|uniref:Uncharacterized protein n=1 Tax=Arctium lappa TaxID=4217 RepID=A0ACB9FHY0_ARCLA|nr:hypothetical protein L6452_01741 [Arctium lappa]